MMGQAMPMMGMGVGMAPVGMGLGVPPMGMAPVGLGTASLQQQ